VLDAITITSIEERRNHPQGVASNAKGVTVLYLLVMICGFVLEVNSVTVASFILFMKGNKKERK